MAGSRLGKEVERFEVGPAGMDPEETEFVLQVKPLRMVLARHVRPAAPEHPAGAGASVLIRIGFRLPTLPLFLDAPIVKHAHAARQISLERGRGHADAGDFDLADEDPQGLAERGVVEQPALPAGVEATQKQEEPQGEEEGARGAEFGGKHLVSLTQRGPLWQA